MIRDTSAQDRQIAPQRSRRKQVVWLGVAGAAIVAVLLAAPTIARLVSSDSSASSARLRIAEVKRGTLTRDISVQGKVVAAVSPTLYAHGRARSRSRCTPATRSTRTRCSPKSTARTQQQARAGTGDAGQPRIEVERAGIDNRKAAAASQKDVRPGDDRPPDRGARGRAQRAWLQGRRDSRNQRAAREGCAGQGRAHEVNARARPMQLDRDSLAFELQDQAPRARSPEAARRRSGAPGR